MSKQTVKSTPADLDADEVAAVLEQLAAQQAQAAEQLARAAEQIAALQTRLARGTSDVTEVARIAVARQAAEAPVPVAEVARTATLLERVEAALRREPMSLQDLCREVRAPAGPVSAARRRLKTYNVGSEERPLWTLVIGDAVDTATAYAKVWQLIAIRPFESSELEAATGIRRGRVQGALVDAQRLGGQTINAGGTKNRRRWFLVRSPKR